MSLLLCFDAHTLSFSLSLSLLVLLPPNDFFLLYGGFSCVSEYAHENPFLKKIEYEKHLNFILSYCCSRIATHTIATEDDFAFFPYKYMRFFSLFRLSFTYSFIRWSFCLHFSCRVFFSLACHHSIYAPKTSNIFSFWWPMCHNHTRIHEKYWF